MIINAIVAYYEAVNCTISTVTLRSVGSREMACRLTDKEMIVLSCAQANKRLMSVCKLHGRHRGDAARHISKAAWQGEMTDVLSPIVDGGTGTSADDTRNI